MINVLFLPGYVCDPDVAYLDIETRKVPLDPPYQMASGEMLKRRWDVITACVIRGNRAFLVHAASLELVLEDLSSVLKDVTRIVYGATREFDEMILKGRFTNARRAHAAEPFYPALAGADEFSWVNVGTDKPDVHRAPDIESRWVPQVWEKGGREKRENVLIHNLRDVCELVLMGDEADEDMQLWCRRVLASNFYAREALNRRGIA